MAGLLETYSTPSKSLLDVGNTGQINFGAITGVDIPQSNFSLIEVKPPNPFKINPIVDSMAVRPAETKDVIKTLALGIPQAIERFIVSTGEALPRIGASLYANTNLPGNETAARIATSKDVSYPGLLGPVESYQTSAQKGAGLGETLFNIATDEPVGLAFKPLLAGIGLLAKNVGGKGIQGAIDEQKQMIQFLDDAARDHRAKPLLKYFGVKSPEDHTLDELLTQAQGTAKKSKLLDAKVTELGFRDMDEAQQELNRYLQLRRDLNDAKETLKNMQSKTAIESAATGKTKQEVPEYTAAEPQESLNLQRNLPATSGTARPLRVSSYANDIAKLANSDLNVKNLNISTEGRDLVERVVGEVKPKIQERLGAVLSNNEALKLADSSSHVLTRTIGRQETLDWQASMLKARQSLSAASESGRVDEEYIKNLLAIKTQGADIARKLQSLSIGADPKELTAKQTILDAVLDITQNTDEVLKAAEGVDFNDFKQASEFYRKFIRPTASDWLDLLRYNSMLSSPRTHIINSFSNFINTVMVAPIERAVAGGIDFVGSKITGGPRNMFAGEAGPMLKTYFTNIGKATNRFLDVMAGKREFTNLDTKNIPIATGGAKGAVVSTLSVPMRLLEASDQFFTELSEGMARAALEYRSARGVKVGNIETEASKEAAYRLFRQEVFDENQGPVLDAIDQLTNFIQGLRANKNPIVSTVAKFTVPFLRTPMNIFKQGIEYSPAGFATVPGAANKTEQIAKAAIGSSVFAAAAIMLESNRLTWGEPVDPTAKQNFRAAGMQPYSVKIGDKWWSYQKLPPTIAFPFAMTAAIHDTIENRNLDDNTADMVLSGVAKYGQFLADQSYAKSIGDLLSAVKGGEAGIERVVSNYGQQLVPFRALGGWLARLFDASQRKTDSAAPFIDQQVQLLMLNIPGLSQKVPARLDSSGNPIPNQHRLGNAFSPIQFSTEQAGGSAEFQKIMEIHKINKKTTFDRNNISDLANAEINKIETLSNPEEKKAYLKEIAASSPEVAKKVVDTLKSRKKDEGLSASEIKLKNASVATRAQYIAQNLARFKTAEEKKAYLKDLSQKKILTATTLKELMKIQNK